MGYSVTVKVKGKPVWAWHELNMWTDLEVMILKNSWLVLERRLGFGQKWVVIIDRDGEILYQDTRNVGIGMIDFVAVGREKIVIPTWASKTLRWERQSVELFWSEALGEWAYEVGVRG